MNTPSPYDFDDYGNLRSWSNPAPSNRSSEMNDKKAAARATIIAELDKAALELSEALERVSNVLLGEGYIVVIAGRGVDFKRDGKVLHSPSSCRVDRAPRFTKRDAEMLAAECTNGAGDKAKAAHIRTALMDNIEEIVNLKISIKEMR